MYEITDIIIDKKSGLKAIILTITDDGFLVGFLKENQTSEHIENNIQYLFEADEKIFFKKPNLNELKEYVEFKKFLLDREIEIFERGEYEDIDILISNLKGC